jgi:predicted ATPase
MARLLGFRVRNFKLLKDITLGQLWNQPEQVPLPSLVAIIGKNGVGKSTLFDVFDFLSDCLEIGIHACELRRRGGFNKLVSAGSQGPIQFELHYQESPVLPSVTYELSIGPDDSGQLIVLEEKLGNYALDFPVGQQQLFLVMKHGMGLAYPGEKTSLITSSEDIDQQSISDQAPNSIDLNNPGKLAISIASDLKQHPRISRFRDYLAGWYMSYYSLGSTPTQAQSGPQVQLNIFADNLGNVLAYLEKNHPDEIERIMQKVRTKVPGLKKIETASTEDGRLLLRFFYQGHTEPYYAEQISDGTLKLLTYMVLLESPQPPPLIFLEEPENGLYHKLLADLALEFRESANRSNPGSQIFVTTHQPYLVDALLPEEVWTLRREKDGFSTLHHASDDPLIHNLVDQGLPLGSLWYSDYLDEA